MVAVDWVAVDWLAVDWLAVDWPAVDWPAVDWLAVDWQEDLVGEEVEQPLLCSLCSSLSGVTSQTSVSLHLSC